MEASTALWYSIGLRVINSAFSGSSVSKEILAVSNPADFNRFALREVSATPFVVMPICDSPNWRKSLKPEIISSKSLRINGSLFRGINIYFFGHFLG